MSALPAPCQGRVLSRLSKAVAGGAPCHLASHHLALATYAWGIHRGALRRAIYCLKYEGQRRIGSVLGEWLGSRWVESQSTSLGSPGAYTVVPIPLHAERLRQRGYNQAALISQAFCQRTGLRHWPEALVRVRATAAQHELNPLQRQHNLAGAFALKQVPATPVLLVDDIYTTGSTVQAAQQVLAAAGIRVAGGNRCRSNPKSRLSRLARPSRPYPASTKLKAVTNIKSQNSRTKFGSRQPLRVSSRSTPMACSAVKAGL
jgi:ComF family protein